MSIAFILIESWCIGIAIAAPVGPIGLLCIRKTLETGLKGCLAVGLGAALADGVYGILAASGLSFLSDFLMEKSTLIKGIGGLFLLYLALREGKAGPPVSETSSSKRTLLKTGSEVFFLTLLNPLTVLSFLAIFTSLGASGIGGRESFFMVLGIFLGSVSWWLILGGFLLKIKHRLSHRGMGLIRSFSALILAAFGLYTLLGSFLE